ncbi:hypothetical protein TFUB22_01143 [Tannerella forsythia]|nr:hypothetical protein TFUB22_01143 [Tannerella forsythia]
MILFEFTNKTKDEVSGNIFYGIWMLNRIFAESWKHRLVWKMKKKKCRMLSSSCLSGRETLN